MSTSIQEVVMLLGDKVIEIHERDKTIRALHGMQEELKAENIQLREDLGKFQAKLNADSKPNIVEELKSNLVDFEGNK